MSLVYFGVTGMTLDATNPSRMAATLNDIAHAVSVLVPVYVIRDGKRLAIDASVLCRAQFLAGAHRIRTNEGIEIGNLSLRRDDIGAAIAMLKEARIRF
jgi:hypothetical protein